MCAPISPPLWLIPAYLESQATKGTLWYFQWLSCFFSANLCTYFDLINILVRIPFPHPKKIRWVESESTWICNTRSFFRCPVQILPVRVDLNHCLMGIEILSCQTKQLTQKPYLINTILYSMNRDPSRTGICQRLPNNMSTPAVINLVKILGEGQIDTTLYLFSIYWLIWLYNDWEVISFYSCHKKIKHNYKK